MKIQAISPLMSTINVQPIKPVEFKGKKTPVEFLKEETLAQDTFTPSDPYIYEKYQAACDLAANYKVLCDALIADKFQQLAEDGYCIV